MKLFWTPASPFTRKVCVVARETEQWDDIEVLPTTWPLDWGYRTVPFTPGLAESNPVARIPTLITDDGAALGDSTLACIYLSERASGALVPEGATRWHMWSLYAIADGALEAQIAMRAELLRPQSTRNEQFLEKQRERLVRCFAAMESRSDELSGPLNLAHIAVGVACGYQLWRDWLDDWQPRCPELGNWYAGFRQRSSMIATEPRETPEA